MKKIKFIEWDYSKEELETTENNKYTIELLVDLKTGFILGGNSENALT